MQMNDDDKSGPPIADALAKAQKRRKEAFQRWTLGQGAKIRQLKPTAVYAACALYALERAGMPDWSHPATETAAGWEGLTMKQVQMCEDRALSTWRVRMHGKPPISNEAWDEQIEQVRAAWAQPQEKAA
jgi:hypothetical protein